MADKQESGSSASESVPLTEDETHFWVERESQKSGKNEKWGDTKEMKGDEEDADKEERVECDLSVTHTRGSQMTVEKFMGLEKFVQSQQSLVSNASTSSGKN